MIAASDGERIENEQEETMYINYASHTSIHGTRYGETRMRMQHDAMRDEWRSASDSRRS